MELIATFIAGLFGGLALAVPLGAIGVLLIQEGAVRGWATASPAAAAVATADLLYCIAALTVGTTLAPVIATWGPWPRIVGGSALLAIAVWSTRRSRRPTQDADPAPVVEHHSMWRPVALFFGLTVINPATLVYFAAIAAGMPTVTASLATAAVFCAGVAIASLTWQLLLVAAGAVLRRHAGKRVKRLTSLIGNSAVGVLGLLMIASALA